MASEARSSSIGPERGYGQGQWNISAAVTFSNANAATHRGVQEAVRREAGVPVHGVPENVPCMKWASGW